jgi:pimeloyl-ACP methyl ester carboxylesterase
MKPGEVQALGDLAGTAVGATVDRVQDMHRGIAGRVFGQIGPVAAPVRAAHDLIAGGVYRAVGGLSRASLRGGGRAIAAVWSPAGESLQSRTSGRLAVGALNGAFGDALAGRGSGLALQMTVRAAGRDVALTEDGLREAFPRAAGRLAIFLHGLCETDDVWLIGPERHVDYGAALERDAGLTPVWLRYNSGLHISDNGRALVFLLDELLAAWPVPVTEIVLIGHSMGGLIARSACHYGLEREWVGLVRKVVTLGTPHRGAPLEQLANAASSALALLPETRTFANALNARSAGIKDMRYGYLVDEDWTERDPDGLLAEAGREIPFLTTADYYFVCATLTRAPETAIARIMGDLLVLRASAWDHGGRGERLRFPVGNYRHLGGATHFDLLGHPAIYEQLRGWLAQRMLPPGEESLNGA